MHLCVPLFLEPVLLHLSFVLSMGDSHVCTHSIFLYLSNRFSSVLCPVKYLKDLWLHVNKHIFSVHGNKVTVNPHVIFVFWFYETHINCCSVKFCLFRFWCIERANGNGLFLLIAPYCYPLEDQCLTGYSRNSTQRAKDLQQVQRKTSLVQEESNHLHGQWLVMNFLLWFSHFGLHTSQ